MSKHRVGNRLLFLTLIAAAGVVVSIETLAEGNNSKAEQMSTPERIKQVGWWPTKGTPSRDEYVGPAICAQCHSSLASTQKLHAMARTSTPAANSDILRAHNRQNFRLGPHTYQLVRTDNGVIEYSVSDEKQSVSGPLSWAFGTGKVGQSYLYQKGGAFFESRFSYFSTIQGFDITPAHSRATPESIEKAAGRPVAPAEVRRCFGCHNTASTTNDKFDDTRLIPSITCEACHGPGSAHTAAMKAGLEAGAGLISNPGRLKPVDQVDFCGACHTTWWDVNLSGSTGVGNARFQPYRLESSRCWGKGDGRVTCIACHNPHQPLVREAGFYDQRCLSCHLAAANSKPSSDHPGAACPVSTKACVTCHMPRVQVPDAHFKFTDHRIRIVRAGSPFPD